MFLLELAPTAYTYVSSKRGMTMFEDDYVDVNDGNVHQRGGGQPERQSLYFVLTYFPCHEHKLRSFLSPTTYTELTS